MTAYETSAKALASALNTWLDEGGEKGHPDSGGWWLDVAYDHPATDHEGTELLSDPDAVATTDGRIVTTEHGRWVVRRHFVTDVDRRDDGVIVVYVSDGSTVTVDGEDGWVYASQYTPDGQLDAEIVNEEWPHDRDITLDDAENLVIHALQLDRR